MADVTKPAKPQPSRSESVTAASAYIIASMLMTLLNKQIISKVRFPGTNFLLFCECFIGAIFVGYGLWKSKRKTVNNTVTKKGDCESDETVTQQTSIKPFARKNLLHLGPCTIAKAMNMYFSFLSMKHTSLPVYNVLKRLNPISGLCIDYLIRQKSYPKQAQLGMLCLFFGAIVTGSGDLDFNYIGYTTAIIAVLGQSSYLVLSKRAQDQMPELSHVEVLFYTGFYNQILFFPLMLPELPAIQEFYMTTTHSGLFLFAVFCLYVCQGLILNYITFWCTSVTSPVTTGVCGSAKALLTSAIGVMLFSANLSGVGWTGFFLNSLGGLLYALSKDVGGTSGKKKEE